jgi:U3 small nucleolar RNA-associated protein 14
MRKAPAAPPNRSRKAQRPKARRGLDVLEVGGADVRVVGGQEDMEESDEGVKSEDDEEIDSDEAFGESDVEKFSSFKFPGSSSRHKNVESRKYLVDCRQNKRLRI